MPARQILSSSNSKTLLDLLHDQENLKNVTPPPKTPDNQRPDQNQDSVTQQIAKQNQESANKELSSKNEKYKGLTELTKTGDEKKDKESISKLEDAISDYKGFLGNTWANGGQNKTA